MLIEVLTGTEGAKRAVALDGHGCCEESSGLKVPLGEMALLVNLSGSGFSRKLMTGSEQDSGEL